VAPVRRARIEVVAPGSGTVTRSRLSLPEPATYRSLPTRASADGARSGCRSRGHLEHVVAAAPSDVEGPAGAHEERRRLVERGAGPVPGGIEQDVDGAVRSDRHCAVSGGVSHPHPPPGQVQRQRHGPLEGGIAPGVQNRVHRAAGLDREEVAARPTRYVEDTARRVPRERGGFVEEVPGSVSLGAQHRRDAEGACLQYLVVGAPSHVERAAGRIERQRRGLCRGLGSEAVTNPFVQRPLEDDVAPTARHEDAVGVPRRERDRLREAGTLAVAHGVDHLFGGTARWDTKDVPARGARHEERTVRCRRETLRRVEVVSVAITVEQQGHAVLRLDPKDGARDLSRDEHGPVWRGDDPEGLVEGLDAVARGIDQEADLSRRIHLEGVVRAVSGYVEGAVAEDVERSRSAEPVPQAVSPGADEKRDDSVGGDPEDVVAVPPSHVHVPGRVYLDGLGGLQDVPRPVSVRTDETRHAAVGSPAEHAVRARGRDVDVPRRIGGDAGGPGEGVSTTTAGVEHELDAAQRRDAVHRIRDPSRDEEVPGRIEREVPGQPDAVGGSSESRDTAGGIDPEHGVPPVAQEEGVSGGVELDRAGATVGAGSLGLGVQDLPCAAGGLDPKDVVGEGARDEEASVGGERERPGLQCRMPGAVGVHHHRDGGLCRPSRPRGEAQQPQQQPPHCARPSRPRPD
jgi:hypothetical protein